jgi:type I restriction enzyme R subunit
VLEPKVKPTQTLGLREIIEAGHLTSLNVYPAFGMSDVKAVPPVWRTRIPEYVKDYLPLNQFL